MSLNRTKADIDRPRFPCGHLKVIGRNARPSTECTSCRVLRWKAENPEAHREHRRKERNRHLLRKFGITLDQYESMLQSQGGKCAICGKPPKKMGLHVDHNHRTGKVRQLLCWSCNYILGYWHEEPARFRKAAEYLERHLGGGESAIDAA